MVLMSSNGQVVVVVVVDDGDEMRVKHKHPAAKMELP